MAMHAQQFFVAKWLVQHHVVWSCEAPGARHIEADPEHPAAVHGIWVWILEAEGGYACTDAIEVLLALRKMFGSRLEEWRSIQRGGRDGRVLGRPEAREDRLGSLRR